MQQLRKEPTEQIRGAPYETPSRFLMPIQLMTAPDPSVMPAPQYWPPVMLALQFPTASNPGMASPFEVATCAHSLVFKPPLVPHPRGKAPTRSSGLFQLHGSSAAAFFPACRPYVVPCAMPPM